MKSVINLLFFILVFLACYTDRIDNNLDFEEGNSLGWYFFDATLDSLISKGNYSVKLPPNSAIRTKKYTNEQLEEIDVSFSYYLEQEVDSIKMALLYAKQEPNRPNDIPIFDLKTVILKGQSKWRKSNIKFSLKKEFQIVSILISNDSDRSIYLDNIKILGDEKKLEKYQAWTKKEFNEIKNSCKKIDLERIVPNEIEQEKIKLVGLGEATHGTKEIFENKVKLIQSFSENDEFNTIIFENDESSTNEAFEFLIQDLENGVDSAMTRIFPIYQTEEIKKLFEWIQAENKSRKPENYIYLTGCDMQSDKTNIKVLKAFFEKIKESKFESLIEKYKMEYRPPQLLEIINEMRNWGQINNEKLSEIDKKWILHQIDLLEQFVIFDANIKPRSVHRDSCMASNILHILNKATTKKAFYWAHNTHVKKIKNYVGGFLQQSIHEKYYALGYLVGKGKFRGTKQGEYVETQIPAIEAQFFEHLFSNIGVENFFLDINKLKHLYFFQNNQKLRTIGEGGSGYGYQIMNLPKSFDAIIYLNETTAAEGLRLKE